MIKKIFCILDEKANAFLTPFVSENAATATRALQGAANDKQSFLGLYPEDYSVYELGSFDDQTGVIVPASKREYCFRILDLVQGRNSVQPKVAVKEVSDGGKKAS